MYYIFFLIDNDPPSVSSSDETPVESLGSVILTCSIDIAENDVVVGYEWYRGDTKLAGENKNYTLPALHRDNSGDYTCIVKTTIGKDSVNSDAQTVTILCKFIVSVVLPCRCFIILS